MIFRKLRNLSGNMVRYLVNDGPAQLINGSYNAYSMLYRGQLSLGLPVSKELIVSQEEIKTRAVQKLALVLYHIFLNAAGLPIARDEIKAVIYDELKKGHLRLTENVILLTEDELTYLSLKRFKVPKKHLKGVSEIARRRRILREAVRANPVPIYFENEIEEKEQNGRGNYEIVHYRNFTPSVFDESSAWRASRPATIDRPWFWSRVLPTTAIALTSTIAIPWRKISPTRMCGPIFLIQGA